MDKPPRVPTPRKQSQSEDDSSEALASRKSKEEHVRAVVRIRPLIPVELVERHRTCIQVLDDTAVALGKRTFTFDKVFGEDANQEEVYKSCVQPLVLGMLEGYNGTVLAYGQTGSGKTYTMGTGVNADVDAQHVGILPRVVKELFHEVEEHKETTEFMLRVSFVELYNEKLKDLLVMGGKKAEPIRIREDSDGQIVIVGATEEIVTTMEDVERLIEHASIRRTTASTQMNDMSSRSHAIVTFFLEQSFRHSPTNRPQFRSAKLHVVDLAGSERAKRTGNVGVRLKESVAINRGLLSLGNVISALGDERKRSRSQHIPYRESKLTRLLQDSLGGNARTVLVACVSPSDRSFEESLGTLKYANRARNIRNRPVVGTEAVRLAAAREEMEALKLEILRKELAAKEAGRPIEPSKAQVSMLDDLQHQLVSTPYRWASDDSDSLDVWRIRALDLQQEVRRLQHVLEQAKENSGELSERVFQLRAERDQLRVRLEEHEEMMRKAASHVRRIQSVEQLRQSQQQRLQGLLVQIRAMEESAVRWKNSSSKEKGAFPPRPKTAVSKSGDGEKSNVALRPLTAPHAGRGDPEAAMLLRQLYSEAELAKQDIAVRRKELESEQGRLAASMLTPQRLGTAERRTPLALRQRTPEEQDKSVSKEAEEVSRLRHELEKTKKDLATVQAELEEAKEDLENDEEIFAEKLREIQQLREQVSHRPRTTDSSASTQTTVSFPVGTSARTPDKPIQQLLAERPPLPSTKPPVTKNATPVPGLSLPGSVISPARLVGTERSSSQRLALRAEEEDDVLMDSGMLEEEQGGEEEMEEEQGGEEEMEEEQGGEEEMEEEKEAERAQSAPSKPRTLWNEHVREVKTADPEEHRKLKRERDQARAEVERMAQELQEMQKEQTLTERAVQGLEVNIRLKEELIAQMVRNERDAETLVQDYDERCKELEKEVRLAQRELEKVQQDWAESSVEERVRAEYEKKLKAAEAKAARLERKHKETVRMARLKAGGDVRIRQLEKELKQMRVEYEKTKRQQSHGANRVSALKSIHQREANTLKSRLKAAKKRIQELEAQRRTTTPSRSRGRATPARGRKLSAALMKKKAWLDSEIEKVALRREKAEQLEREVREREAIVRKKEEALAQRGHLEIRRLRASQHLQKGIVGVSQRISHLSKELQVRESMMIQRKYKRTPGGGGLIGPPPPTPEAEERRLEERILEIRKELEEAQAERAELEQRTKEAQLLSPEDELEAVVLDDRIEALEAEAEYKAARIKELADVVHRHDSSDGDSLEVTSTSEDTTERVLDKVEPEEAKELLREYVDQVISLRESARARDQKEAQLRLEVEEERRALHEVRNSLRVVEMETDRKFMEQERAHEQRVHSLLKQIRRPKVKKECFFVEEASVQQTSEEEPSSHVLKYTEEQLKLAERDASYHRKTNENLKRKMRELHHASLRDQEMLEKQQREMERTKQDHVQAVAELRNVKQFLREHTASITPVRRSLRDLRPVSREDLQSRGSGR